MRYVIQLCVLGCQLVTPVQTRWNSYYDARRSLLLHNTDKIDQLSSLSTSLGVPNFNEAEYAFMKEEMQVLTPLAQGLDCLQGHANPESYMAFLYPTLLQLRHNYYTELANSQVDLLKCCSPLVSVILADINIAVWRLLHVCWINTASSIGIHHTSRLKVAVAFSRCYRQHEELVPQHPQAFRCFGTST